MRIFFVLLAILMVTDSFIESTEHEDSINLAIIKQYVYEELNLWANIHKNSTKNQENLSSDMFYALGRYNQAFEIFAIIKELEDSSVQKLDKQPQKLE